MGFVVGLCFYLCLMLFLPFIYRSLFVFVAACNNQRKVEDLTLHNWWDDGFVSDFGLRNLAEDFIGDEVVL